MAKISVDECRRILGNLADGRTDADIEEWRDKLTVVANEMYDVLQAHLRNRPMDEIRWTAYMNEHPEDAADTRVGGVLAESDRELWAAQSADDIPEDAQ